MQYSELTHDLLCREGSCQNGITVAERISSDFIIDGQSLLAILTREGNVGHTDFMGCFVFASPKFNHENKELLLLKQKANLESGRVALYVCPECGDIGCGALTAFVSQNPCGYIWHDFAYENGYEAPEKINNAGPFIFESQSYEKAIIAASAP
jgi:hypothetical protein